MNLPKAYFRNKQEQGEIEIAILKAIPKGVYIRNVIVVLTEMLLRFVIKQYRTFDVYSMETEEDHESP
jgi:hypothetical protein